MKTFMLSDIPRQGCCRDGRRKFGKKSAATSVFEPFGRPNAVLASVAAMTPARFSSASGPNGSSSANASHSVICRLFRLASSRSTFNPKLAPPGVRRSL